MNTSKVQTSSTLLGLGYLPIGTGTININSFSLGATTASSVFSTTIPVSVADAATMIRVMFSGTGNTDINNQWVMTWGALSFNDTPGTGVNVGLVAKRSGSNITIQVQFYNGSGASKTVPAMTVTCKAFPYTAPWD